MEKNYRYAPQGQLMSERDTETVANMGTDKGIGVLFSVTKTLDLPAGCPKIEVRFFVGVPYGAQVQKPETSWELLRDQNGDPIELGRIVPAMSMDLIRTLSIKVESLEHGTFALVPLDFFLQYMSFGNDAISEDYVKWMKREEITRGSGRHMVMRRAGIWGKY